MATIGGNHGTKTRTYSRTRSDTHSNSAAYSHANAGFVGVMSLDQFATVMVALGALSAVVAIRVGNPTAMALLASAIVSSFYSELVEGGVIGFYPVLLVALDLLVVIWIVVGWANAVAQKRYGRKRDLVIIALFIPIWPLYFDERAWTNEAIDLLVATQMLLSFPVRTLWAQWGKRSKPLIDDETGSMELVWRVARA